MSILVDWELRAYFRQGLLITNPRLKKYVCNGVSGGVSSIGYDVALLEGVTVPCCHDRQPGEQTFALAKVAERFCMPRSVSGFVHDKSTWARSGIMVQNTVIEPGWCGELVLELTNHGPTDRFIEAGTPIAQVIFHAHSVPAAVYSGKYQNQTAGQGPIFEEDKP